MKISIIIVFAIFFLPGFSEAQKETEPDYEEIRTMISRYKDEVRGPYKDIRWFCKDGSFSDPKLPCGQEGSVQRARYKDEIETLARKHRIYLGQILAATDPEAFWDNENFNDRYKQYQLEQYLRINDDGWINRKAQFYRGAIQVEDEMKWGKDFLQHLLSDPDIAKKKYFLLKQAVRTLPHAEDDRVNQRVRAISKDISDREEKFMKLRIKIHGNPDKSDLAGVESYLASRSIKSDSVAQWLNILLSDMRVMYSPLDINKKIKQIERLSQSVESRKLLTAAFLELRKKTLDFKSMVRICDALVQLREDVLKSGSSIRSQILLDLAVDLEDAFFSRLSEISADNLGDLNFQICYLSSLVYSTGFLEKWEWEYLEGQLSSCQSDQFGLYQQIQFHRDARNGLEWGVNMVRSYYNPTIQTWGQFEPLSFGLVDDIVRSSFLLPLGQLTNELGTYLDGELKYANKVFGKTGSNQFRGLNPGYAKGKLRVVSGNADATAIDRNAIYIFDHPPSDLKPVAGIATVSEGNPVSHIQLLARNLGIPNLVIGIEDFNQLRKYNEEEVFLAVSPAGNVVMKLSKDMDKSERELFELKQRTEEKVNVPTDKLKIAETSILDMRKLDKSSSGIYCGPKAANLAELKRLFPKNVVDGLVIPFGIFKQHMEQIIPGQAFSYWQFVQETFEEAGEMAKEKKTEEEIEIFVLERLARLRDEIKKMPLLPTFQSEMADKFKSVLGAPLGEIPVFLRSDTNMEDLKDFTGAGLNLTLFNIRDKNEILQGIKDVWASPYSERSFKWRQKFLLNPENVFPSILIIPGVNVDYSGVLITKGLKTNDYRDYTLAMNKGVGGAVDGQAAESYSLNHDGQNLLNAPAREIKYRYLPSTGGSKTAFTDFSSPLLSEQNLRDVRRLGFAAWQKISFGKNKNERIAHDIEFGFLNNKIWLFQVRPFVENKNAQKSEYLNRITPPQQADKLLEYSTPIQNILQ